MKIKKSFSFLLLLFILAFSFSYIFLEGKVSAQFGGGSGSTGGSSGGISYSNYSSIFGGKITNTKATEIEELENNGYQCEVNGTSITIRPIKGPETYIIPSGTNSRTGTTPASGQWIIGKYSGKTTVTCTKQCGETECTDTVDLDTITLFGTSQR